MMRREESWTMLVKTLACQKKFQIFFDPDQDPSLQKDLRADHDPQKDPFENK